MKVVDILAPLYMQEIRFVWREYTYLIKEEEPYV